MEKSNNFDSILQDIVHMKTIEGQMNDLVGKNYKDLQGNDVKNYYNSIKEYSFVYDLHKQFYLGHFSKVSNTEREYDDLNNQFKYMTAKMDRLFMINFDHIWSNAIPKFVDHKYIK